MNSLPPEVWVSIFELASDEDVIFHPALPTCMAESAWHKDENDDWKLRSPDDAIQQVQRRSYSTKAAIIQTCKNWRSIGSEFLFRCLFFDKPGHLLERCAALDASSASATTVTHSLGWWTRRIHLTSGVVFTQRDVDPVRDALTSIIRHCPNLEILVVDAVLSSAALGPVVDALTKKALRTFSVRVLSTALPRLIWALDALRHLFAVHVDVEEDGSDETPLGAACDIQLRLTDLRQLSLRGHVQQLVEEATGWHLPALRFLAVHTGDYSDLPDVLGFLAAHGSMLHFLDIYLPSRQSVPQILAACPALTTLVFNGDWRVVGAEEEDGQATFAHERLVSVGMHKLFKAFGFDRAIDKMASDGETELPVDLWLTVSANERTFSALCAKEAFPALARIRAVDPMLLYELHVANGPKKEGGGMERWDKWWNMTSRSGVRLEDCTGNLLGVLPPDHEQDGQDEEDQETEWEEDYGSWDTSGDLDEDEEYYSQPGSRRVSNLDELKVLLEECRAMEAGRLKDDDYLHQSPEMHMIFPEVVLPQTAAS
ncbi:NTF2 domain-containing protein [Mycena chlorophos]|uniref:NTF2 domain-containing protein n=1 Tax=Mycena chlorophos TaxID=658473 RepID=A0A8H6SKL8_MYCCL|nr:NTF2 domain-containing protein [Mycena chlorophos]